MPFNHPYRLPAFVLFVAFLAAWLLARNRDASAPPSTPPPGLRIDYRRLAGDGESVGLSLSAGGGLLVWERTGGREVAPWWIAAADFEALYRALHAERFDRLALATGRSQDPRDRSLTLSWPGTTHSLAGAPEDASARVSWERAMATVEAVWATESARERRALSIGLEGNLATVPLQIDVSGVRVFDTRDVVPRPPLAPCEVVLRLPQSALALRVVALVPAATGGGEREVLLETEVGAGSGSQAWLGFDPEDLALVWRGAEGARDGPGSPSHLSHRRAAVLHAIAAGHVEAGEALDREGRAGRALREWRLALRREPDHAPARARLGFQRDATGWVPDPTALVDRVDRAEEEAADARTAREQRDADRARRDVERLNAAAREAEAAGLVQERDELCRIVLEYDPDDAQARRILGFTETAGAWLGPAEAKRRAEFAEALAGAQGAGPADRFVLSGGSAVPEQLPLARATREIFHRRFDVPLDRELFPAPMRLEMLGSAEEWAKFVDEAFPEADREYAKTHLGAVLRYEDGPRLVANTANADAAWKKDLTVHDVTHALLQYHLEREPPLWLQEGIASVFQFAFLGAAQVGCIPSAPTAENPAWDLAAPSEWRRLLRRSVIEEESPALAKVVAAKIDTMSTAARIKTYSFVDWLLAERRAELIDLLSRLRAGEPHDEAVLACFRVEGLDELDRAWKDWVLRTY